MRLRFRTSPYPSIGRTFAYRGGFGQLDVTGTLRASTDAVTGTPIKGGAAPQVATQLVARQEHLVKTSRPEQVLHRMQVTAQAPAAEFRAPSQFLDTHTGVVMTDPFSGGMTKMAPVTGVPNIQRDPTQDAQSVAEAAVAIHEAQAGSLEPAVVEAPAGGPLYTSNGVPVMPVDGSFWRRPFGTSWGRLALIAALVVGAGVGIRYITR